MLVLTLLCAASPQTACADPCFSDPLSLPVGSQKSYTVLACDLDADGAPELVAGASPDAIVVFRQLGSAWTPSSPIPGVRQANDLACGDVDGDGKLDVAAADYAPDDPVGAVVLFAGDGAGGLQAMVSLDAHERPHDVELADLDKDGDLDVVATSYFTFDHSLQWWLGNGDGTFGAPSSLPAGTNTNGLTVVNLDLDGDLDCVVTNRHQENAVSFLGDGAGGLAQHAAIQVGGGPIGIDSGDLDGDGLFDLVIGRAGGNDVAVLRGLGDGTFQSPDLHPAGLHPGAVSLADVDGDGRLDVVTANGLSHDVSVLRGLGLGQLEPWATLPAGDTPLGLATADLDGDGQDDVAVANRWSADVTVVVSQGCLPAVESVSATSAAAPGVLVVTGEHLDAVTAAAVAGAPAQIVSKACAALELAIAPGDPGFALLELVPPPKGAQPALVELWPSLLASTTGAGGVLEAEIDLGAPGMWSLAAGAASSSPPLVLPGIAYGLLIDLSQPWVVIANGVLETAEAAQVALPVPPLASLSGSQWCLQGWGACWPWPVCAPSFTNAVELTIP